MSREQLTQINGRDYHNGGAHCQYESEQMERLIVSIEKFTEATNAQNENFKLVTKYLLIVVCVIAVGQKAFDAAKEIWGNKNTIITEAHER